MNNKEILKKYTNTKKQPILLPYLDDIKFLFENNASQLSMLEYLKKEKSVIISPSALSIFIKKHIKKEPYKPPVKDKIKKEDDTPKPKKKSLYLLD